MMRWLMVAACCALPACSPPPEPAGQGDFAVLAQGADGFEQARPGVALEFPRDFGAHPGFRIEWWYLTANLEGPEGEPYGAQWTLFRTANEPPGEEPPHNPWQDPQVFMAHLAITTPDGHVAFQRYARGGDHGGIARAGVESAPFAAWLDDWSLQSLGDEWLPLRLEARQGNDAVRLHLTGDHPPVPQGDAGFSQKHPRGGGSYYYSQPFLTATGELELNGKSVAVTGRAWLDHEWSSRFLQPDQAGWDWFALHLDSGEKLMLFRLRAIEDSGDHIYGVLIGPSGDRRILDPRRIELEVLRRELVAEPRTTDAFRQRSVESWSVHPRFSRALALGGRTLWRIGHGLQRRKAIGGLAPPPSLAGRKALLPGSSGRPASPGRLPPSS